MKEQLLQLILVFIYLLFLNEYRNYQYKLTVLILNHSISILDDEITFTTVGSVP